MPKTLLLFILSWLLLSCASGPRATDEYQRVISHIKVELRGKNLEERPTMVSVCTGFALTEKQVLDFFAHAATIAEPEPNSRYNLLPCYSSGTARINNEEYKWTIRSGGIGEFYNDKDKIIKICGKHCCTKVANIC
jgi:hypothetical protein